MVTTLQKVGLGVAGAGLALAALGAVLVQGGPRHLENLFGGVHTSGKVFTALGLGLFLVFRVFGRHADKLRGMLNLAPDSPIQVRQAAQRVAICGALIAAFAALWMWPMLLLAPRTPLLFGPFVLGHVLGMVLFFFGGLIYVLATLVQNVRASPVGMERAPAGGEDPARRQDAGATHPLA